MIYKKQHYEIVLKEITRHLEDSETSKLAHWNAAAVYEKRHKFYLGLPTTIISLLLAWLLSTQFTQSGLNEKLGNTVIVYISVLFSLLVSVLSGLLTFLNFNDLAIKHRTAAENYHALWRDCKNWRQIFPTNLKSAKQFRWLSSIEDVSMTSIEIRLKFPNGLGKVSRNKEMKVQQRTTLCRQKQQRNNLMNDLGWQAENKNFVKNLLIKY